MTKQIVIDVEEFTDNVTTENIGGFKEDLTVKGDGIFDVLMNTATSHLKAQFDSNRLRDEDYATAYIQVYQATLQAALQAWLQKGVAEADIALKLAELPLKEKDLALKEEQVNLAKAELSLKGKQLEEMTAQLALLNKQTDLLSKQINSEEAKRDLYRRQIEGFDEDYKQKILKICMDSWAVGFSVARDSFEARGIPAPMQKVTIDDLYNRFIVTELDRYNY